MANHQPTKPEQLLLPLTTAQSARLVERQRDRVVLLLAQLLLSAARPPSRGATAAGAGDEPR